MPKQHPYALCKPACVEIQRSKILSVHLCDIIRSQKPFAMKCLTNVESCRNWWHGRWSMSSNTGLNSSRLDACKQPSYPPLEFSEHHNDAISGDLLDALHTREVCSIWPGLTLVWQCPVGHLPVLSSGQLPSAVKDLLDLREQLEVAA